MFSPRHSPLAMDRRTPRRAAPLPARRRLKPAPTEKRLKAHAPTLVSPANDLRLDSRRPTLVANAVAGKFVGGSYWYEFELLTDGNARVDGTTMAAARLTTWAYPADLGA